MSSGREVTSVNEYPTADGNVGAAGGRDVLYAQVCPLDLPYRAARLFDYKIPAELQGAVRAGDFVTVPFGQGNRPCTALVMGVSDTPSPREGGCRPRYKEICDLLGSELHLSEEFLGLVQYMQEHLFCSIGEAVYAIIPAFMLGRADREYMLTERGRALVDGMNAVSGGAFVRKISGDAFVPETFGDGSGGTADATNSADAVDSVDAAAALTPTERRALALLMSPGTRSGAVRISSVAEQSLRRALARLEDKGCAVSSVVVKRIGKSYVETVRLAVSPADAESSAAGLERRAPVMAALLRRLSDYPDGARLDRLCSELGCDRAAVTRLVKKGFAQLEKRESYRSFLPTAYAESYNENNCENNIGSNVGYNIENSTENRVGSTVENNAKNNTETNAENSVESNDGRNVEGSAANGGALQTAGGAGNDRASDGQSTKTHPALGALSPAQQRAYEQIEQRYSLGEACASLLYGVTGSGKTRVIKAMIDRVLADGRQVIVLVPEISLTPQTVSYFSGVYGDRTVVIHSMLSHGERYDAYRRIKRGEAQICIGTRSAVFASFDRLGLIVIDEEQEHTYKSDSSPRYHARDVAAYRCGKHRAMLLLASATPSVESFYKASSGRYQLVRLDERFSGKPMPAVTVSGVAADLRCGVLIGRELDESIRQTLAAHRQVILFMNRRGYNHFMICPSCREAVHCPNCSVSMTYHTGRTGDELVCHFCGHRQRIPEKCPSCGCEHMTRVGFGIQRVEEELKTRYPSARILRMDADTTSAKNSFYEMLGRFRAHEYDILLGTQMVTKGHDFPAVDVSGVILADTALYLEDFRASERAFSMITQLVGRAGRAGQQGKAVIQTCNPDHPVIECASRQDYDSFYRSEIAYRRAMLFPPFCHIALISVTGEDERSVMAASTELYRLLTELIGGEYRDVALICFGPFEAAVYRVNRLFRYRIVCKIKQDSRTRELLRRLLGAGGEKGLGGCTVSIDIDPDTV